MGGSMAMEIMLDTGKKDGIKEIEFLSKMEALQNHIDKHPLTWKTSSIIDLLKKMRRAMHENQAEYYTLPETSAQAAEYLFLYETSGGEELDKQVSFNYDIARLNVRTKSLNTKDVRTFMSDIDRFVKENLDPSIKVEYTGVMSWLKAMSDQSHTFNRGQAHHVYYYDTHCGVFGLWSFKPLYHSSIRADGRFCFHLGSSGGFLPGSGYAASV
jgi:predicted RND superfamily exporter protein